MFKRKSESTNKKVRNATKATFDGIDFRSKLEVYTYQLLKLYGISAAYENFTFTLMEAFKYQNESIRKITYTPDFVGEDFVIECKGFANEIFPIKWKLFKNYLYTNGLELDLYLPKNKKEVEQVVREILKKRNGK